MTFENDNNQLEEKFIVLAVTGGIASYKSIDLARLLTLDGAKVQVVLTQNSRAFIQALPFQILTGQKPIEALFPIHGGKHPGDMPHISLTDRADLIVLAPATANIIAKFARGIGDDFVSTLLLSAKAPVLVAPAMNPRMWTNPVVQENVQLLRSRGHLVMNPGLGRMARAEEIQGRGRMPEPSEIRMEIRRLLIPDPDLAGLRLIVSAGPTREKWDAVRFLSNRSSGKMGFSLALAAISRGAEVTLVSGPVNLPDPSGVNTIRVESAAEMRSVIVNAWKNMDAAIMAAAVADYRPATPTDQKQKKEIMPDSLVLERTPDIIAEMGTEKGNRILVGFAAETDNLRENALDKLHRKNLDLIVANAVSGDDDAMGSETSRAHLFDRQGNEESLPLMEKRALAEFILDRVAKIWEKNRYAQSS